MYIYYHGIIDHSGIAFKVGVATAWMFPPDLLLVEAVVPALAARLYFP